jgi:hypothetical protein
MTDNHTNRLAYQGKVEAQLIEWGSEIDRWQNQTASNMQAIIGHLNHKRQIVRRRLGAMQVASDDTWQKFMIELNEAVEDMRYAVDFAREQIHHARE